MVRNECRACLYVYISPSVIMATKKPEPAPKKKSTSIAGGILDGVGWVVREAALPIPDSLVNALKKKKKK